MGLVNYIRSFRPGAPVNKVANTRDHNRIANILNDLQGVNCRVVKPLDKEGLGWRIVVDKSSDIEPPDGKSPFSPGGGGVPADPDPYTTIGGTTEGSEAADSTTWTYGDVDGGGVKKGLRLYVQTRQAYFHAGDHKWYAYVRLMKFSAGGLLYSVGAETRVEIEDPVNHADL
jgi:hypothetical protein